VLGVAFVSFARALGTELNVLGFLFYALGAINLALAFLNMLPGLPLDGGRVFMAVAWRVTGSRYRGAMAAANAGRFLGLAEILVGLILMVFYNDLVLGVSLLMVGWFLRSAAGSARQRYMQQEALKGLKASDVAVARWPRVTIGTAVSTIAEDQEFLEGRRSYLVYQDGAWAGMLPVRAVKALKPEERRGLRVGDVMVPREEIIRIRPDDDLLAILQTMDRERVGYAPVLNEKEDVAGVVSRDLIEQTVVSRTATAKQKSQPGKGRAGR
jgi:predicted transcriptional regulator